MFRTRQLVVLLAALSVSTSVHGTDSTVEERITAYARPLAESGFLSGCLVVSQRDQESVRACFGYADGDRTVRNDFKTQFCVASLTKPMTAVAIMRLVDEEALRLDDPVTRWIDDFPSGDSIAVVDLMTHTAGVPHRVTTTEEEAQRFTPAEIVERIKTQGLLFEPHSDAKYSSAGYTVLAYIMELTTGKSYGDAMDDLIFKPLGMDNTVHPDGRPIAHGATSFVTGPNGPKEARAKDYAFLAGAGSLYSTGEDVARFARAYLDRELLSEEAWEEFHNMGWASEEVVRWNGTTNGFASWVDIYKADGSVHVFVGNAGTGAANILRAALPALIEGEEADPPPPVPTPVTLTAAQMRDLVGGYSRDGKVATLTVKIESGALHMGDNVVYPIAVDRFFDAMYFSESEFVREDGNEVTIIRITAPGLSQPLIFKRVPDADPSG